MTTQGLRLGILAHLLGLTVSLAACDNPVGEDSQPRLAGRYTGTLTTLVEYRDAFGRVIGRDTYTVNGASVVIAEPRSYKGQREENPVSFILESNPGAPGAVSVYSSFGGRYTDPATGRAVDALFTSWSLSASGNRITGRLVDNLTSMASSVSHLLAGRQIYPGGPFQLWPYPLQNGTTMSAELNGETLTVRL
jgi:hypothetical protein